MGEAQMSRVQRELLELKQRGQVKTRADKLQEFASPLTTPEAAQAFLSSMRGKQKSHSFKPPSNLSADGMDAWYMQQRSREIEMRKRQQEAQSLLRGYRMTWDGKDKESAPRRTLSQKAFSMRSVAEAMADPDSDDVYERPPTLGIQRLTIDEKFAPLEEEEADTPTAGDVAKMGFNSPGEAAIDPALRQKASEASMAEPQTQWRDFVEPEPDARFPPEKDRYHMFASYACPGSHRALIVRALKGLEDVVSVTIVHPVWRLTKEGTDEEQRGWVFGHPDGDDFTNTAGRGGPFPSVFPGSEPEPFFNSFSVRDIYDQAGDVTGKYTVPFLWDKKEQTIVNNESSDIAYMLNSSFNVFAKNPELDLYTEDDSETLNDVIDWLSPLMIHGVYRCGFAKRQEDYDTAVEELTDAFDQADSILQKQRYLTGDTLTDADIRLFVTLFRFDEVYFTYFRANTRLVTLTPSLLNYCREIYQMEGVAQTCSMEHCKAHFFCSHAEWNKFSIVPKGLAFLKLLNRPHDRELIPKADDGRSVKSGEGEI